MNENKIELCTQCPDKVCQPLGMHGQAGRLEYWAAAGLAYALKVLADDVPVPRSRTRGHGLCV